MYNNIYNIHKYICVHGKYILWLALHGTEDPFRIFVTSTPHSIWGHRCVDFFAQVWTTLPADFFLICFQQSFTSVWIKSTHLSVVLKIRFKSVEREDFIYVCLHVCVSVMCVVYPRIMSGHIQPGILCVGASQTPRELEIYNDYKTLSNTKVEVRYWVPQSSCSSAFCWLSLSYTHTQNLVRKGYIWNE